MTKELKNCPFCDSDDIGHRCDYINDAYWIYWMECYNCYARGPERYIDGEEVSAWNNRSYEGISVEDLIIYNCEKYGAYGSGGGMATDSDGKLHKTNMTGDTL